MTNSADDAARRDVSTKPRTTTRAARTPAEPDAPVGVIDSFKFAFSSPVRLRKEVFGGLVVALALIPEAISFSIVAGVDPRLGLFASFAVAVTIAFTGGRPAMISGAAGSIALVIVRCDTASTTSSPPCCWPAFCSHHGAVGRGQTDAVHPGR